MKSAWSDTHQMAASPGPHCFPPPLQGLSSCRAATSPAPPSEPDAAPTLFNKDQNVASLAYQQSTSVKYSIEGPIVSEIVQPLKVEMATQVDSTVPLETTNSEINRILARIEQDNRLLAELETSRTTIDLPLVTERVQKFKEESRKEKSVPQLSAMKQSVTLQQLEQLMAKLEQDNKILAELDKKRNVLDTSTGWKSSASNGICGPITPSASLGSLRDPSSVNNIFQGMTSSTSMHHAPSGHTLLPTSLLQRFTGVGEALTEEEMLDSIDFIELPGRGRCNIFCARYTYDPLKQSPNENPEAELALNAGDYVIIYGEMDEDGFFNGELLDGRKGLVPSNFVEKLTGEELFDFHATVLYGNRDSDDSSVSFSYAQDMEMTVSDDYLLPEDIHRMNDYIDLDDVEDVDEDTLPETDNEGFSRGVPPPQRLILERQLNKSLLIGWVPPDVSPGTIEGYHVYVDGFPKATIKFSERTRALIEGVDSPRPHRISVRSISSAGFHSKDAACTIVVGKDFPLAPTCVKACQITATSALVSWVPSNSNFQHVVAVNSVEVKIVKPGCFRHRVTGLSPNNLYRVSVRVKPGKLLYNDEKNPKKLEMLVSNVEFRTLPKGLPDPPVNVQVEQGPQDGTLLVTWLPVPTHSVSPLVSSVVGYAVFAAGKRVAEIDSPSGDHALIDGTHLLALNKKCITVRSKSTDGLSSDSLVCVVPNDILRTIQKGEVSEDLQIEGRSELSDIVEEEEEPWTDTGEGRPKMISKVENINELEEYQNEDQYVEMRNVRDMSKDERNMSESQNYYSKPPSKPTNSPPNHPIRRTNPNPPPSPVPSQRRQGWREQSYSSRSITLNEENGIPEQRLHREQRNSSGQIILDPDENLSDKEIYPSSHVNIPSIEITKDNAASENCHEMGNYSDDDYQPRRRARPPTDGHSSQQARGSNREMEVHQPQESRVHTHHSRGPQTHHPHTQQSAREKTRRQPHEPPARTQPHVSNPSPSGRQKTSLPPRGEPNKGARNVPKTQSFPRSSQQAELDSGNKRRSVGQANDPLRRRMPDLHDAMRRYEDPSDFDSFTSRVGEIRDNTVRYFVALFDYDPQTMSPNPDAADEELPFREGHVIKIYGDKDPDGFYRGEYKGQIGLVPGNMVSELPPEAERGNYNDNVARPKTLRNITMEERDGDLNWDSTKVRKMVAIYDYDPQEISPNVDSEMELSFCVGDVIFVVGEVDEDGFYMGEINGVKGLVPSNFLREVPFGEEERRHSLGGRPKGQSRSYLGRSDHWNVKEI